MKEVKISQKVKDVLKIVAIYTVRQLLKLLWIFPVKRRRIVFNSFTGKQYSDNPKYIFLDLYREYGNSIEYIWCRNQKDDELLAQTNVKIVKFLTPAFLLSMITCGVYVTNCSVEPFIPKRKTQLYICTWHGGGAYKGLSKFYRYRKYFEVTTRIRAQMTDSFVSSSTMFTKLVISEQWQVDEAKTFGIGMPRNDILVREQKNREVINRIKAKLGIPADRKIVLYAPTMRGQFAHPDSFYFMLDIESLLSALKKRFGEDFTFVFRGHHAMLNEIHHNKHTIDVSSYNDMQELLLASDVLITDYSSAIWDFSLMFKPGFLFTPDLDEYKAYQNFLTPISDWPFPYARTNEKLAELIINFNEKECRQKIERHHNALGSFENGTAVRAINKIIREHMTIV